MGLFVISGVVVVVEVLVLVDVVVVVQTGDEKSKTSRYGPPSAVDALTLILFDPAVH